MEPQLWASGTGAHNVPLAPVSSVLTYKAGRSHQVQHGLQIVAIRCVTQTLVSFSPLLAQPNGPLRCHLWVILGRSSQGQTALPVDCCRMPICRLSWAAHMAALSCKCIWSTSASSHSEMRW